MPSAVRPSWPAYVFFVLTASVMGQTDGEGSKPDGDQPAEVEAGHSYHGEVFNEGPRQSAYLMDGLGRVRFPVTTSDPMAQRFVTQGVAQLHGFWYFEAERSFRQAAAIDPECAMAYWGMAMANQSNQKRAKGFLEKAVEHKAKASRREKLYIDALKAYHDADSKKKKERDEAYTKALESLIYEFPDDLEAKAFLALQLWSNRSSGIPIASHLAIDALIQQVLAVEPLHPVHHYRIHLWDYQKAELAVSSAAQCGQSLPAIAHMWHMPGHIFSRLKRYDDAAWQQEASARVDHAHMMRDSVMPDQIHNFAHNNEWLIRNLNHIGRFHDAIDLAKNMIELPRHPKYNTLAKRGSTQYGRHRLFETLSRYELWDDMIALCGSSYLEPTDSDSEQVRRLRYLGVAHWRRGDAALGAEQLAELQRRLDEQKSKQDEAADKAREKAKEAAYDQKKIEEAVGAAEQKAKDDGGDEEAVAAAKADAEKSIRDEQLTAKKADIDKAVNEAKKPFNSRVQELEQAVNELLGWQAYAQEDAKKAFELLKKARGVDAMVLASVQLDAGDMDEALKAARKHVDSHKGEVHPLAMLAEMLWRADKQDEAKQVFEQLRDESSSIDLESAVFARLQPIVAQCEYPANWPITPVPRDDIGVRPSLDSLGPFRWQPSPARGWTLSDAAGNSRSLSNFQGQPLVVIFYLGYGCLHCAEQLQAFAPKIDAFQEAGMQLVAISTDDLEGLKASIKNYDKGDLPIPLLSNAALDVFQAYRCYDDFEKQPLHGTFLIDGSGRIRWQDISYEPFMEPDFLLGEAKRLLAQDGSTENVQVSVVE